jgi:prepilin-type N-terminal cleavage/methylation domain-containing protein
MLFIIFRFYQGFKNFCAPFLVKREGKGMKIFSSEEGFTLTEILCTLVIFSIFVAVAVPRVVDLSNSAKTAVCKQNQNAINTACAEYLVDEAAHTAPGYPEQLSDLVPKYFEKEPVCPVKGAYLYDPDDGSVSCSEPGHDLIVSRTPETSGEDTQTKTQDPQ